MGLSTAGLAFRRTSTTPEEPELIHRAFGDDFELIPDSESQSFHDIRVSGNLAVETIDGATFIYNGEFASRILFKGATIEPSVFVALGKPEVIVVFCHFDSGSFGYAILEGGVPTRSRLYTNFKSSERGSPKDFELPWLKAEPFVEEEGAPPLFRNVATGEVASEGYVTAMILRLALKTYFGICPWDKWNYRTKFNNYRRNVRLMMSEHQLKKAWWKIW